MSKLAGKRIAIVGGGSAGMVAAFELLARNSNCKPVIFEKRSNVGGIWQHEPNPGPFLLRWDHLRRPYGLTGEGGSEKPEYRQGIESECRSPMYEDLRTNITSDSMAYRDEPFAAETELFPSRPVVQSYLESFAERHDLLSLTRLSTRVDSVRRVSCSTGRQHGEGSKWEVRATDLKTGRQSVEHFDYVVSANGRCNVPKLPPVPGLHLFKGSIIHSAWYRFPTDFANKRVLIVGHMSSGMDIARELVGKLARQFPGSDEWVSSVSSRPVVRQSVRDISIPPPMDYDPLDLASPEWARRIKVVPRIERVTESGSLILEDGEELEDVDTLVFATGYLFAMPYLDHDSEPFKSQPVITPSEPGSSDPEAGPEPPSEMIIATPRVSAGLTHLDDWQLFHRDEDTKSIIFLGLPSRLVPFPFTQVQARFAASFWNGDSAALPNLDLSLPITDPDRWTSRPRPVGTSASEESPSLPFDPSIPQSWTFARPSDTAYMDALLELLPGPNAGGRAPWDLALPTGSLSDEGSTVEGGEGSATSVGSTARAEAVLQDPALQEAQAMGGKTPRGVEGDWATAAWRRLRRVGGRTLRRENLGY